MHQRIIQLLVLLVSLWAAVLHAQRVSQNSYYNYNSRTGLPSNKVNSVVQDERGFLWLATQDGLVRFDGIRYRLFRKSSGDPNNIPFSSVEYVWIFLPEAEKSRHTLK
jgi:ligand-binding sensor domain-containing protein